MPRLSAFYGIVIYMYWDDHQPPHYHAQYGGREAIVAIVDATVIAGSLPSRTLRRVVQWHHLHQAELEVAWARVCQQQVPATIEPLP